MEFNALLTVSTTVITTLAWTIWSRTKSISFLIGIGFLYYWSLFGAWFIVADKLGGDSGMHYYNLERELFTIRLDGDYAWALVLYSVFIILVELVLLLLVKPEKFFTVRKAVPVELSHSRILVIAALAGVLSFLIVKGSIASAAALNVATYTGTRPETGDVSPLFTLHQVLDRIALVAAGLGFVVWFCGDNARLISGRSRRWTLIAYLLVLGGMFAFNFVLGDKSELLFAGLTGFLFYLANSTRPRILLVGSLAVVGVIGLGFVGLFRGVPLPSLYEAVKDVQLSDVVESLKYVALSNEAFAAHFSMYGAISFHVQPTWGSSFVSLALSVVPRVFWPGRPNDIYFYYADRVGAEPGRGYTLLHATGWYLNFGTMGVVLGALVLGWVWARSFNAYTSIRSSTPSWSYALRVVTPWTFVAYFPAIVRAGIEVYKGVALEAFLIPSAVIALAFVKVPVSRAKLRPKILPTKVLPRVLETEVEKDGTHGQ